MYRGERLNSITHLIGAVVALAGAAVLVTHASIFGDRWSVLATTIYGSTMVILYTFSTLYHSFQGPVKKVFQKLDHIAIYLLIAGTYTPFCLISLRGQLGFWILIANWSLAALGILCEFTLARRTRAPSIFIYLFMGWMILFALKPLTMVLPARAITLLGSGGILYTGGIIFFLLDEKIRHFHGIWHLFVLGGTVLQYFSILLYLIPDTPAAN